MPVQETHLAHFNLLIDGSQAAREMMSALLECTVENSLHLPDMCTIRIEDSKFTWVDDAHFVEGKSVEIQAGDEKQGLQPIFKGEITGLELDMAAHGHPTLVIRCLSKLHRLHRGRQARTFVQVKDSDLAQKIGAEVGLSVNADDTQVVHDWVIQDNQTNWEFLRERASRCGCRLYLEGEKTLCFQKVDDSASSSAELTWGDNLRSFRPRTSASPQVDEVVVRGWNPKTKQAIVGRSTSAKGLPKISGKNGSQLAKEAYGAAKMMIVDYPIQSQQEAQAMANSIFDTIGGNYLEAEGLCYGQTNILPGVHVEIKNIGQRFSGKYYVTATTHVYSPAEGYSTLFSVTGKQANTLLSLVEEVPAITRSPQGGTIVIGIVTDNNDPDKMGRVKVKYPWLTEDHVSDWARTASQMAGDKRGMFNLPEINDEVLVAFEQGDIHRPIIIGMLWNGKDTFPTVEGRPMLGSGQEVNRRGYYTRIGHKLIFDDTDGKGDITIKTSNDHLAILDDANKKIEITTKDKHRITMDDGNKVITVVTKSGHKVELNDSSDRITVTDKTGGNKMTISSGDNSIKLECRGNFTVDAMGKVSIEGKAGVDVKTPAMMNLEGTGMATLKSSGILTVQGSLVKIN